jgi:hypothetical protein
MNKRCKNIYAIASDIVLGKVPTKEEIVAKEQEFQKVWDGSGQTDFSFYDHPDYMYLALNSWTVRSWSDVEYCVKHDLLLKPKRVFDYCGGIGMSACLLATVFPDAECVTHNIAPKQRDAASELARRLNLSNVKVVDKIERDCDLLLAQETFEHIKDPFKGIQELLDVVKPKQYLDASTFGIVSPGHFDVYTLEGRDVPRDNAKRPFNAILRANGFERYWKLRGLKSPYNGHPALWEKKS